jgi:hypothetical protein
MGRKNLKHLDLNQILDSEDEKTLHSLDKIPGFKDLLVDVVSTVRERYMDIEWMGNGVCISQTSYPRLYNVLKDVCKTLGYNRVPTFSLEWNYNIAMATEGVENPRITALSGTIDILSDDELRFLIGHEIGHLMSGHKPYHMLLTTIYSPLMNIIPNPTITLGAFRPLLLKWYRASDFTADRFGLLACQDINVVLSAMIKMAGLPLKYHSSINVDSFIKQAGDFERMFSGISDQFIANLSLNAACSPWLVARAAKLYKWYKSNNYKNIVQCILK